MDGAILVSVLVPTDHAIRCCTLGRIRIGEIHPVEADVPRADEARTAGAYALNRAARAGAAVAGDCKACGRPGGVQDDAIVRTIYIDTAEGQPGCSDASVSNIERRPGGRGERVNDRRVVLRRADRAATGRREGWT